MNSEWSLKELYSGYEDTAFHADLERLKELVTDYNTKVSLLDRANPVQGIHNQLLASDAVTELSYKLYSFCSLSESVNSADKQASAYIEKITKILNDTARAGTVFEKFVADVEDLESVIASDELLTEYAYCLRRLKELAMHNHV